MFLKEFPDIKWLKSQIEGNFHTQQGWDGTRLAHAAWPTVILNVNATRTERPDIRGPLSIFTNITGESFASVGKHRVKINNRFYFISNQNEHYTLEIEKPAETFNIHFGDYFSDQVYQSLVLPHEVLLEQEFVLKENTIAFFNKLYAKDSYFEQLIHELYLHSKASKIDLLWRDEQLTRLLIHLLSLHHNLLDEVRKLPSLKSTTKLEIYKRLNYSLDYLYTYYHQEITLDQLAQTACLSKFHFLRLFKIAFGQTPHQCLLKIRMEKARMLLKHTSLPIQEIALALGFDDSSTFSRAFFQKIHCYPTYYRSHI